MTIETWAITPSLLVLIVLLSLSSGWALGQYWRMQWIRKNRGKIRREAREIIKDAERKGKATIADAEIAAKEFLLSERRQHEENVRETRSELSQRQALLSQRESQLSALQIEIEERSKLSSKQASAIESTMIELTKREQSLFEQVQKVAGMNVAQASEQIMLEARKRSEAEARNLEQHILAAAKERAEAKAHEVVATTIERISRDIISERSTVVLPLPTADMKSRLIGRDGRNVRAFEALSGVDLLLDDVPEHVIISSHDVFRKEVAKEALVRLMGDGRIQPARIEEFLAEAKLKVESGNVENGRRALGELGLDTGHEELVSVLGKLRLRSSYTQNVLLHSLETAFIAASIAAELGMNLEMQTLARRAGLFHDIGKALNEKYQGPHALVGAEFLSRFGEHDLVINAVAAHHGESDDRSILAPILRAADALSGARPGARRENIAAYIERLQKMEELAKEFPGVKQAYALQAGRELHVIVESAEVSDERAHELGELISRTIERQVKYVGQLKVTVIRELRVTHTASWSE